jgi:hypothetical protein
MKYPNKGILNGSNYLSGHEELQIDYSGMKRGDTLRSNGTKNQRG